MISHLVRHRIILKKSDGNKKLSSSYLHWKLTSWEIHDSESWQLQFYRVSGEKDGEAKVEYLNTKYVTVLHSCVRHVKILPMIINFVYNGVKKTLLLVGA